MKQQQEHISTRFTLVPITEPQHQKKLLSYMSQPTQPKTSFCRFYLRGLCIMKPELCKFAHNFEDLILQEDPEELLRDCHFTQKQRKKLYFQSKQDFQQKALFILKNVDYAVLYNYQFSQKWKNSSKSKNLHSLAQIKEDRNIRLKLRQVLHRENWSKLIDYLLVKYPGVDFSISFMSKWFSKVGFEKPQTRCKFGDFMRYMLFVKQFKQVNIIMPPRVQKTVFFIDCRKEGPKTYIWENITEIQQLHFEAKQQYKKELLLKLQPLPQEFRKKFMCRYFMAGNCQFTEQQCNYAHSIEALKFQIGQKFLPNHKQMVKGKQERLNYVSLFRYSKQKINPDITLEELNANSNLRCDYRKLMHLELYSNFMTLLKQLSSEERLKFTFVQRQYNGAGFNHSTQNKFGQFQSSLWDIGYIAEEMKLQNQEGKSKFVFKIPPIEELDEYYCEQVNLILEEEVRNAMQITAQKQNSKQKLSENTTQQEIPTDLNTKQSSQTHPQTKQLILQSAFRKKLYHNQPPFTVPFHVYLRLKQKKLQQIIKEFVRDKSLLEHIFFQTNEQNYKKLVELCKSYFKDKKDYIHKADIIEFHIKSLHKDKINLNSFVNFKNFLQCALVDAAKKVYFLAFGNNCLVLDKGNMPAFEKNFVKPNYHLKNYEDKTQQNIKKLSSFKFHDQRIVIVDNQKSLQYAQLFLSNCNKFGVDLEGRLKKQGYIDLIQVSAIYNAKKQIFVFDIFLIKKSNDQTLYQKVRLFLKTIFEDPHRVKIMHDCKQDSTALRYLMQIELKNVFDTSGMNILLEQKHIYETWNKQHQTTHHIIRKIFEVKTPGLNTVLQKWGAPNGVNIFKQSMKKMFHSEGTRYYFQQRPIDPEFLQYSAQDVQDLIDIYEAMKKADTQKVSEFIGQLYVSFSSNQ